MQITPTHRLHASHQLLQQQLCQQQLCHLPPEAAMAASTAAVEGYVRHETHQQVIKSVHCITHSPFTRDEAARFWQSCVVWQDEKGLRALMLKT